jgi:hypothetical protein
MSKDFSFRQANPGFEVSVKYWMAQKPVATSQFGPPPFGYARHHAAGREKGGSMRFRGAAGIFAMMALVVAGCSKGGTASTEQAGQQSTPLAPPASSQPQTQTPPVTEGTLPETETAPPAADALRQQQMEEMRKRQERHDEEEKKYDEEHEEKRLEEKHVEEHHEETHVEEKHQEEHREERHAEESRE